MDGINYLGPYGSPESHDAMIGCNRMSAQQLEKSLKPKRFKPRLSNGPAAKHLTVADVIPTVLAIC